MDQPKLNKARIPITLYKEDPEQTPGPAPAEWHEVWCATNPAGEWVLCERYGWWDNANKQALFNVPILSEPFTTEKEANDAVDTRIKVLEGEGWIHKLTTRIPYRVGRRATW